MQSSMIEYAHGSITGSAHLSSGGIIVGKNNQDALSFGITDTTLVAVICDGCGSGLFSEVGARLAAKLTVRGILHEARFTEAPSGIWYIGDGVHYSGKQYQRIGPFPKNAPPYMGYQLTGSDINPDLLLFRQARPAGHPGPAEAAVRFMHRVREGVLWAIAGVSNHLVDIREQSDIIEHMFLFTTMVLIVNEWDLSWLPALIGSDGVADLVAKADQPLPQLPTRKLGGVEQFFEDHYYENEDNVNRLFRLANSEKKFFSPKTQSMVVRPPLLPDDTTLFAVRRKKS